MVDRKLTDLDTKTAIVDGDEFYLADSEVSSNKSKATQREYIFGQNLTSGSSPTFTDATINSQVISTTLNQDVRTTANPTFNSNTFTKYAKFGSEFDNGTKTTSHTIDFANGQKQKVTYTANTMTVTLSAPGPGNYQLKIINGGLATVTWSSSNWVGGTVPTLTSSGTDIISFYYDGTTFWSVASLDFS